MGANAFSMNPTNASVYKESICMPMQETQETRVQSLGREDPLKQERGTCPSILAWKIPWRGAWQATVHRVAKIQTGLSMHAHKLSSFYLGGC